MPSEVAPEEGEVRRLHPTSLIFSIGAQAKSLLLPGLVVLFFAARGDRGQIWLMLLFVPAVVAALFRYWSYRYRFDLEELVIREGIVFRNERHIPYARIQNIDLVQNPLHRLFGVAEIRLETAGGQKPEAVMRVLSLDAVERMRSHVFVEGPGRASPAPAADGTTAVDPGPATPRLVHGMNGRDVLLFGLISNKGMVVVAAALGVFWQLDLWERWASSLSRESLERYEHLLPRESLFTTVLFVLAALVALLVGMRLLSVLWAFGKFHGFRLTRRGDDLRAEYGLLPHVSKTIPRQRIQLLSMREGFLHRRCGRVAVQVETAGSAGEEQGPSSDRLWLAPLIRRQNVASLLHEAIPELDLDAVRWEPVSSGARGRIFRRLIYVTMLATAGAVAGLGVWGLVLPLPLVPIAWLHAKLWVAHAAYALTSGAVLFRSGWWNRRLSIARFGKIQSLERAESPFDRRHGMASLHVDTAGASRVGHAVDIPYLDGAVASRVMNRLYDEAGRTAFRW
jgi:putative membrane protein